ncbi:glycosyltransferase [Acidobacteria bacterium AB60]|nr:glycosyltransferase [Acidobacteria bacterium AB60]
MLDRMQDPFVSCTAGFSPEVHFSLPRSQNRTLNTGQTPPFAAFAATAGPHIFSRTAEQTIEVERAPAGMAGRGDSRDALVVAHVVEGCQGGVGTAVRHLIEEQDRDERIRAVHLLADPARLGDMLSNVPAQPHWYTSSRATHRLLAVSRSIREKLREIQPDVVYLHSTFPGLYGRLVRSRKCEWVTVYCPHGWAFTQSVSRPKKLAYAAVERILARRADAIISVSRHEHQQALRSGVRHDHHRVILHGLPVATKQPSPAILHIRNRINLLFIGRFDRQKGLDLLLDAWRDPRLKNFDLWLIGDATLGSNPRLPVLPNVHNLGWVKNDRIDSYIQSFDAVIVPSRWEAFGLVALEAMRNGRPVIASRTGGLQEVVLDRVNGVLFEPGNREALIAAVAGLDKQRLAKMGSVAREVFHTGFEWPSCYEQWKRVTEDAVTDRRTRRSPQRDAARVPRIEAALKRGIDVTASCGAILAFLPLLLIIAMAIKLTSRGPILFGHSRCGRDGRSFRIWKFRTMVLNADKILHDYLRDHPEAMQEWKKDFKLRKDPRITRLGRFLRRYSLDEIPQLINVISGDMSLVGPRPIVQNEVERYADTYDLYTRVKPGITGLWQVSGRNNTTYAERVAFDAFYVNNWSIWLDLSIIWKTFYVVLAARGSY